MHLNMFQSTHPRRVRQVLSVQKVSPFEFQSTHPRRVRRRVCGFCIVCPCFNPRTHVGCDIVSALAVFMMTGFNPRTHVGCDSKSLEIHTIFRRFQSTHPRRVRHRFGFGGVHDDWFQSTHPRRVRRVGLYNSTDGNSFNPRTHVGCDCSGQVIVHASEYVSIHAPT